MSTTGSPELNELLREMKAGYRLERTGGGHYRIIDSNGRYVEHNDKVVSLSGTAHGGSTLNNMRAQLKNAGVLKGEPRRPARPVTPEGQAVAKERMRQATAERNRLQQERADSLYRRLEKLLGKVGGLEGPGMARDLSLVGSEYTHNRNGHEPRTPDLMYNSIYRVLRKEPIAVEYNEIWNELAGQLEQADDLVEEWFRLVRHARGLPDEVVVDVGAGDEDWPFTVELIPYEALMVDHDYQRPVPWPFVRKHAATFDPTLVGTIDVAQRRRGAVYAIMDGQLRYEMCRLVGKKAIWCSVYSGMDKQQEARFFLHKNRDKKAIHPFYTFRARIAAGDPDALAIKEIVEEYGYEVTWQAAKPDSPQNISAIAALEEAFNRRSDELGEDDCLRPTLRVLKRSTWGMHFGQNHILIRALAIIFEQYTEEGVGVGRLQDTLRKTAPEMYVNRAREASRHHSTNAAWNLARLIVDDYNRGLPRAEKLERL